MLNNTNRTARNGFDCYKNSTITPPNLTSLQTWCDSITTRSQLRYKTSGNSCSSMQIQHETIGKRKKILLNRARPPQYQTIACNLKTDYVLTLSRWVCLNCWRYSDSLKDSFFSSFSLSLTKFLISSTSS